MSKLILSCQKRFHGCGMFTFMLAHLLCLSCICQFIMSENSQESGGAAEMVSEVEEITYRSMHSRSLEVQKLCKPHLTRLAHNASFLKEVANKEDALTLTYGEWKQVSGKKRFMSSFADTSTGIVHNKEFQFVSLYVTDVDVPSGYSLQGNMVNVSAVLQVGELPTEIDESMEERDVRCITLLKVGMEGVYAELENGERVVCMLGSSTLPLHGENAIGPWDCLDFKLDETTISPTLVEDLQIKVVFNFPRDLTLMSRGVLGRLESLHDTSDSLYFDPVDIFSLSRFGSYQFLAGDMVNTACAARDPQQGAILQPSNVYRGNRFCSIMQDLLIDRWIDVLPNWNCFSSSTTCNSLGPFLYPKEEKSLMAEGMNGSQLFVQDFNCVSFQDGDKSSGAYVSAVMKAVLPFQSKSSVYRRHNLDALTLAVEGKWNSNSGELCMIGCRGGDEKPICEMRISMFIPLTLSLKRRNFLEGSISGINRAFETFYPLSFHIGICPFELPMDAVSNMSYEYTKVKEAAAFMQRDQSSGVKEQIKKSLFQYPSAECDVVSLIHGLSFRCTAVSKSSLMKGRRVKQYLELKVLAIEEHVKKNWLWSANYYESLCEERFDDDRDGKTLEPQESYKVAAQIMIEDYFLSKAVVVSTEGLYDPAIGKMYLVGCKEVSVPWQTLQKISMLLEDGLDCSIEIKVEYPPTNSMLLMNPTIGLTITSVRARDDPFFFMPIELETFPLVSKKHRKEIVSRRSLEGGLSMLTMSPILGCSIAQLVYMKSHPESTPYISLLMLAMQGIDFFSIPFIADVMASFATPTSSAEKNMEVGVLKEGRWSLLIGCMVNLLAIANFLCTLRILQKVHKSRVRLRKRQCVEAWSVPSDKKVMATWLVLHVVGFSSMLIIDTLPLSQHQLSSSVYMDHPEGQYDWKRISKKYYGLVQDLFLLPQVIGNLIWKGRGKPLKCLFYVGITVLRLLPHVYNWLRPSSVSPYPEEEVGPEFQYADSSSDFFSMAGDMGIPLVALSLAVVVYLQQKKGGQRGMFQAQTS